MMPFSEKVAGKVGKKSTKVWQDLINILPTYIDHVVE
jgi:hypothetical protein